MSADRGRAWNVGAAGPALRLVAETDPRDYDWRDEAACASIGGDLWFADNKGETYTEAKAICGQCPVVDSCLEYALAMEAGKPAYGVWGGLSPKERASRRRARRNAA